jgi:hypothetical protein
MAGLSGDYNTFTGAVEIWPQLLEAAWAQMKNGYGVIGNGTLDTGNAWLALTGTAAPFVLVNPSVTNEAIAEQIQNDLAVGQVKIGTINPGLGKSAFTLPGGAKVFYEHAYIVDSLAYGPDDAIIGVNLLNPWGPMAGNYQVFVPLADFNTLFANIFSLYIN